jgi:putative Ca2+/H+ antiporter (TMEM165/GDT1 family)
MSVFFYSAAIVAIGEMGDKTQLLSIMLAARYRSPWVIALAVLAATLANHALAALAGEWLRQLLSPTVLRYAVGLTFLAMAAWVFVPDKAGDIKAKDANGWAVFGITFLLRFLSRKWATKHKLRR